MVSCALDLFDTFSILNRKRSEYFIHELLLSSHPLDGSLICGDNLLTEKGLKPVQFNEDSEAHQSELGEVWSQRMTATRVSTINWTDSREWCDLGDALCI